MDTMKIDEQTRFSENDHQMDAEKQMMIKNLMNQDARRSTATTGFSRRPTFASQNITMPCRPSCSVSGLVPPAPVKPRTLQFEQIRPSEIEKKSQLRRPHNDLKKFRISENDENNYCSYNDYAENDGLDGKINFPPPKPIFEKEDDFTEVPKMGISADIEFESEICHVISPSEFYVRPYPSIVHNIQDELTSMMNNYECNSCPITKFITGMYCTKSIEGIYKRLKILKTSVDRAGNDILIMIDVDSGARIWCGTRGLCPLPLQFRYYQQQAIACRLFGLAPSSSDDGTPNWAESVVNNFKQFCGLTVQANVLNICEKVADDGSFTVSMYKIFEDQKIWAHEYLLSQHFATGEELKMVKDAPAKLYNF